MATNQKVGGSNPFSRTNERNLSFDSIKRQVSLVLRNKLSCCEVQKMKEQSQARIISYNRNCNEICASAARISTTRGDADEIFELARGNAKNTDLTKRVLKSGHKSIIEHAVFTIAFCNVSVFVEQYLIECRLASFTVKSRRYVDFSGVGYYVPPELEGEPLALYRDYMDTLFSAYGTLLERGVPKEDARFLLPYSFRSNFYCTLNARELAHVIGSIRYGRGRGIPELNDLADQLVPQIEAIFPALLSELEGPSSENCAAAPAGVFRLQPSPRYVDGRNAASARLIGAPPAPLDILRTAHRISAPDSEQPFRVDSLLSSPRPRELEQLAYSFLISDITLAGLTHLVRHRMQSVVIPPVQCTDHSRYIVPASVKDCPEAWETYSAALERTHDMLQKIAGVPLLRKYGYYFVVSGNTMDVMTTANGRELMLFLRLRTCSRAQWEIRGTAVSMLRQLREHCPELYDYFGPSCFLLGRCPEGKLTCGNMDEVCAAFDTGRRRDQESNVESGR